MEIRIEPEFERIIPPLSDEEFRQLKANILSEGEVFTPIFTWNGAIVDGHHRYRIICEHPEVRYRVLEREFSDKYSAVSWICNNQLGRRNLTPRDREYLIGKRYEAEKRAHGASDGFRGNQHSHLVSGKICHLPDDAKKTRERIAEESGTSERYVSYAEQFAKGIDAADEAVPGIKHDILSGTIKPTKTDVIAIGRVEPEQRKELAEALRTTEEPAPKKKSRREILENYRMIRAISAEMEKDKPKLTARDMIAPLCSIGTQFINACDFYTREYPELLDDDDVNTEFCEGLQELHDYIHNLDRSSHDWNGGTYDEDEQEEAE